MASLEKANSLSNSSSQSSDSEKGEADVVTESGTNSFTRRRRTLLACCLSAQFLSNVCQSLPAPFLPSLNESHNMQSDMTGWIIGLMPLTRLFMGPVFGKVLTRVSIKTLLVSGLFICGGFTVLFGMLEYFPLPDSSDTSIDMGYLIFEVIIRILQAVGAAAILIAGMTLLSTTFVENTTTILGYSSTAMGLGYMCGPAIGSGLYAIGGFTMVFSGIGGLMLLVSGLVAYTIPSDEGVGTDGVRVPIRSLLNTDTVAALALTVFIGTIWSSIEPVIEPELRTEYGLTEEVSALTFLLASFANTVSSPIIGISLDTVNWLTTRHLMALGFIVNSVNFSLMGPAPWLGGMERPLWLLLLCLAVLGFAVAVLVIPSLTLISFNSDDPNVENAAAVSKAKKAMLASLWSSAYSFGDFLGPTFSGIMTAHESFAVTMTSYSVACMSVAIPIIAAEIYILVARVCTNRNRVTDEEALPLLREQ